ncbi:MAG: dihydroorotate dehydrogenase electron transfer subunit [Ignavibacteria bacterium]|nr:dihydroorotate dehydrogenase electron transfer subunit [Ignavibacteria bacterium]
MTQEFCHVQHVQQVADNVFVLTFSSEEISESIQPGQFINIKVNEGTEPLLRRPFSVYRTDRKQVQIIFNVIGKGTAALRKKNKDDWLDVLGPLGVPFGFDNDDYKTAILIGGGLGVAPLPILTKSLKKIGKGVVTFLGSRSSNHMAENHLENLNVATDDGSKGFHGTVVDLAKERLSVDMFARPKIFACGPTPMLRAVASMSNERDIPCEASLEGPMACGFGICQGCPVELIGSGKKYALVCKDGPVFDIRTIRI